MKALRGECVVCGAVLTEADYNRQAVVAAIGPEGTVVCCASHVKAGAGKEYENAMRLIADAKIAQIRAEA
jgi:hypothetical protein